MRALAIMLLVLGFCIASDVVPAVAQHHAAPTESSEAEDRRRTDRERHVCRSLGCFERCDHRCNRER
jgi:hypothetical protein